MANFFEDYKRPEWQKFRLEVFEHNNFACQYCGEKAKQLHAHHFFYRKGAKPWEYDVREVHCLCDDCHEEQHTKGEETNQTPLECLLSCLAEQGIHPDYLVLDSILGEFVSGTARVPADMVMSAINHPDLSDRFVSFMSKLIKDYSSILRSEALKGGENE